MPIDRSLAWRRSNKRCHYCFVALTPGSATRDHVVPRIAGGPNHQKHNIVIACQPCNRYKGSMTIQEFLACNWLKERRKNVSGGANSKLPLDRKTEEIQERIRIGLE